MSTSLDALLSRVASEGLGVLDAAGRMHAANGVLRRWLEEDAKSIDELPIGDEAQERLRQFLAGEDPHAEITASWRAADGVRVMTMSLLRGEAGRHAVAVRDDTDLHAARRELERCTRLRGLGRIARHLVHDMNNHMSAVLGLGEALTPRDGDDRRLLEALRSSAARAGRMLEAVAMLVRRAGMRAPSSDLGAVAKDAVRLVHKPMLVARRSLEVAVAADVPAVRCVPQEMTHALVSLLLFANETALTSPIRLEVIGERRHSRDDLPARPCGVLRIEDGGDAERSPLRSPDVRLAVGVVQARGAWLDVGPGPRGGRRLDLAVPASGRRPA